MNPCKNPMKPPFGAAFLLGVVVSFLLSLSNHGVAASGGREEPGARATAGPSSGDLRAGLCNRSFITVFHALDSGLVTEEYGIIDNEGDWCVLWDQIHSPQTSPPPCDTRLVDFGREVAVIAALGVRPTGCYDVDINCIHSAAAPAGIRVLIRESVPGDYCECTQALTSPVLVAKVARPVSSARFNKTIHTLDCGF